MLRGATVSASAYLKDTVEHKRKDTTSVAPAVQIADTLPVAEQVGAEASKLNHPCMVEAVAKVQQHDLAEGRKVGPAGEPHATEHHEHHSAGRWSLHGIHK